MFSNYVSYAKLTKNNNLEICNLPWKTLWGYPVRQNEGAWKPSYSVW